LELQKIAAHISNLVQALAEHQQLQQQQSNGGTEHQVWADILLTFMANGPSDGISNGRRQSSASSGSMGSRGTPLTAMAEADAEEEDDDEEDEELQMD
jgi:hypothetical protein